ncbi:MAG: N-glycosylase/DNA lyase [Endomicrobium sp.]|jgi:N-glycosylase/DNA lyase|nr:N-glycosylase/DNA lyase [Endomicrobium sp.]
MQYELIPVDFLKTPIDGSNTVEGLKAFWRRVLPLISQREKHFADIWEKGTEEQIFAELVFCLFTPQSKAVSCWNAVKTLAGRNMMFFSDQEHIAEVINGVRFKHAKAGYLVKARDFFTAGGSIKIREKLASFTDIYELRKWLISNVKGVAYKEAGHFLRNIGIGGNLAILDRHILKNLELYGVIKEIPKNLSVRTYLEIEKKMQVFAFETGIAMSHLDMLFWCRNTGGIFK